MLQKRRSERQTRSVLVGLVRRDSQLGDEVDGIVTITSELRWGLGVAELLVELCGAFKSRGQLEHGGADEALKPTWVKLRLADSAP